MPDSLLLICTRCCSLEIEGPEQPQDDDLMRCRNCGHQQTYREMRAEFEVALKHAVLQIHQRVARKIATGDSAPAV